MGQSLESQFIIGIKCQPKAFFLPFSLEKAHFNGSQRWKVRLSFLQRIRVGERTIRLVFPRGLL